MADIKMREEKEKIPDISGDVMFVLTAINGEAHSIYEIGHQTWIIYRNGHVCSNVYREARGETEVVNSQLSRAKLFKLRMLCCILCKSNISTEICFDGTIYEMTLYNKNGIVKGLLEWTGYSVNLRER